jgi:hypothetical protein
MGNARTTRRPQRRRPRLPFGLVWAILHRPLIVTRQARRRFGPSYTNPDVIRFVAQIRATLQRSGADINNGPPKRSFGRSLDGRPQTWAVMATHRRRRCRPSCWSWWDCWTCRMRGGDGIGIAVGELSSSAQVISAGGRSCHPHSTNGREQVWRVALNARHQRPAAKRRRDHLGLPQMHHQPRPVPRRSGSTAMIWVSRPLRPDSFTPACSRPGLQRRQQPYQGGYRRIQGEFQQEPARVLVSGVRGGGA